MSPPNDESTNVGGKDEGVGDARLKRAIDVWKHVVSESVGRYRALFERTPPSKFAQFVERVPMVKGRLDRKAATATGYAWPGWEKGATSVRPHPMWIPPCRKQLERDADYITDIVGSVLPA